MKQNKIIIAGLLVSFFAVVGTAIVSFTEHQTHERIAENERLALLRGLYQLVPQERFDNDLSQDTIVLAPSPLLGHTEPSIAYRARKNNQPSAIIFNVVTHSGYNGDIFLLVAINIDGSIAGVRAVKHKETPGLGDVIDIKKSNWIKQFDLKSLLNPDTKAQWAVKKDNGVFDQMTGATITPRAIVAKVYDTLSYYEAHKATLFDSVKPNTAKSTP